MVKYLCNNGADINCIDYKDGYTPIIQSITHSYSNIVKYLCTYNVDLIHRNDEGLDAILNSILYTRCPSIIKHLCNSGLDFNCCSTYHNKTAVVYASENYMLKGLRHLIY